MALSMFICLSSVAQAAPGTATYYMPPYVPSACFGCQNNGVMVAAASIWNNRAACGRSYRVTCIGSMYQGARPCTGKSVVKIVDYCPPGAEEQLIFLRPPSPLLPTLELAKSRFNILRFDVQAE
ncbi:hypothetical protein TIFTF001_031887 [Ficus carica]|uniref:EG45-like domain containing protein n=1 Tax=Ficus carica TaxID=3494 RepID=A0AA88DW28_FICCA|nr:hypothetical protein TIFTF001_031887 [Ficus carica]